jgi:hypothetical protein
MENIKKKLSEIGYKSRKQIEFEYNIWKLRTKNTKIDFFARESIYPNFFYSINLSVDKVYNARKNFWIATLYRKITFDFEDPGNLVEGTFSKSSTCFINSMPKHAFST